MQRDQSGLTYTGAGGTALDSYLAALADYHRLTGKPPALLEQALADSPDFVMAYLMKAYLMLLGTNPVAAQAAGTAYEAAAGLPMNDRERAHMEVLGLLFRNEMWAAARALEDLSIAWPRDVLAIQVGQVVDFFVGDSRMLRDRILRALPHFSRDMPDWHAIQGMLAFGLEETADYDGALAAGFEALAHDRRNTWAHHAIAHVHEMRDQRAEGAAWMRSVMEDWATDSFFSVHNHWHLALFHLGLGDIDEVLRLYDGPIYGTPSDMAFDQVDASAMLWRLHLRGVDVGARWEAIADTWQAVSAESTYGFSDAHAMMAFVGSGREDAKRMVLDAQARAMDGTGDNLIFVGEIGGPVTRAIAAFGEARYGDCVELLRPVRNRAARFGGSHAQRDLIDLTLLEAARRDGQGALAAALQAERDLRRVVHASRSLAEAA